jgi:hypothetical protein
LFILDLVGLEIKFLVVTFRICRLIFSFTSVFVFLLGQFFSTPLTSSASASRVPLRRVHGNVISILVKGELGVEGSYWWFARPLTPECFLVVHVASLSFFS